MYYNPVIPFYVAYPEYPMYLDEYRKMQDLEYLQNMYPATVKNYQKKINQVLDRLDYEGSVIYDEYPDRISLYKLTNDITQMIISEQKVNGIPEEKIGEAEHIGTIVQILLYHEIHKRRYKRTDSFLKF